MFTKSGLKLKWAITALLALSLIWALFSYLGYLSWASWGARSLDLKGAVGIILKAAVSAGLILLLASLNRRLSYRLLVSILSATYLGVLVFTHTTYGALSLGIYSSMMETSPYEALEMSLAGLFNPAVVLSVFTLLGLVWIFNQQCAGRTMSVLALGFSVVSSLILSLQASGTKSVTTATGNVVAAEISGLEYLQREVTVLRPLYLHERYSAIRRLQNAEIEPAWSNVSYRGDAGKAYIVIVGESVGRDDLKIYNRALQRHDPLADDSTLSFVARAVAPAPITRVALEHLFTVSNDDGTTNRNLNIFDLARASGLKTFWFSNQGVTGEHDTPITNLVARTDNQHFHNEFYQQAGTDFELINDLKQHLQTDAVFFMHMIGAHHEFCQRARVAPYKLAPNTALPEELNCHASTVYNTEMFIRDTLTLLAQSGVDHEVVYFSDHGLVDVEDWPYKIHGIGQRFAERALNVPLIFISSSNQSRPLTQSAYFMRDFPHTFADWIGIAADQIDSSKSVFSITPQQERYVLNDSGIKIQLAQNE